MARQSDRPTAPTHKKILDYWFNIQHEELVGWEVFDNIAECSLGHTFCWACGIQRSKLASLEKCHIVPHSLGGSNEPSNYFLMCNDCHSEAPDTKIESIFFKWLRNKESYITERLKELSELFKPHAYKITLENAEDVKTGILATIEENMGSHGGKISRSTIDGLVEHTLENIQ